MSSNRVSLYLLANLCFAALVAAAAAINNASGVHPLYLILLFALCSTSIIDLTKLNGSHALLGIFSVNFFLFYGSLDLSHLVSDQAFSVNAGSFMSAAEAVILCGGALVQIAYRIGLRTMSDSKFSESKDWTEFSLVSLGGLLWLICTALRWDYYVYIIPDPTIEATERGLATLSALQITGFMLAGLAQPLGILIIAYAQCRYRRSYMSVLLVGVVLVQFLFGFVIDYKGEALVGGVLVILTKLLVDARIPKAWVVAMLAFIVVGFPILQANRVVVRGQYGGNSTTVGQNIGKALNQAFTARTKVTTGSERSQTIGERLSLKGSVETIVMKTGDIVPFQRGFTLSPLVTSFIPRLVWHDKPVIAIGRLMNKEFKVSEVADTYISPSHLGELYWNFGWAGVGVGMTFIGFLLGGLGARFNLAQATSITRLMVVIVSIRLLILGSEGEIATQYVLWIRSMLAIGVLHWCFARIPVFIRSAGLLPGQSNNVSSAPPEQHGPFPNLLR